MFVFMSKRNYPPGFTYKGVVADKLFKAALLFNKLIAAQGVNK